MKLTKSERHTAYIIMLATFHDEEYGEGLFFCNVFEHISGISLKDDDKDFKEYLPELWAKKPRKNLIDCVWFYQYGNGLKKRINLLKQCIEETYDFEKEAVK